MNADSSQVDSEEFKLMDVFSFLKNHSKLLFASGLIGLVIGAIVYTNYPAYKGSVLMPNISDPMLIKKLQFIMPRMAATLNDTDPMKAKLTSEKFWLENFIPNYVIKKQDLKELKEMQDVKKDEASVPTLTLTLRERSPEDLNRNMDYFINFIKEKSALYFLEDLMTSIQYQSAVFLANYDKVVLELEDEKKYTLKKINNLESIGQQFKGANSAQYTQLFDLKDGGSKFLPLNVQLIALRKELSDIDIKLERNQDAFDENAVRVKLHSVMADQLKSCGSGMKCLELFLDIANKESVSLPQTPGSVMGYKRFKIQLEAALSQNTNGYAQLIAMTVEKTSIALFLLVGAIAGLILGFLGALSVQIYKTVGAVEA
jgi:hypothetical protein